MPEKNTYYLLPLLFLFFLLSCNTDPGLEPTSSGFSGTVKFINDWPVQTDQVLIVASTKFPPASITELVLGDPLPLNQDSVNYQIYTPPGDFEAVGVVWKEKDQPWDVTNIIGIYFPTDNHYSPGKINISSKEMLTGIDITADLSKAKRKVNSGIKGELYVKGEWPAAATSVIMIASSTIFPTSLLDLTLGQPIDAGFDTTSYSLTLQPGNYYLVGAIVLETGKSIGFESIKGAVIRPLTVDDENDIIENVNITIDFTGSILP